MTSLKKAYDQNNIKLTRPSSQRRKAYVHKHQIHEQMYNSGWKFHKLLFFARSTAVQSLSKKYVNKKVRKGIWACLARWKFNREWFI